MREGEQSKDECERLKGVKINKNRTKRSKNRSKTSKNVEGSIAGIWSIRG